MKNESIIQIQIADYLSTQAERNRFFFFSVPNEGFLQAVKGVIRRLLKREPPKNATFAMMTTLKKMGLTPGVPDLIIFKAGRAYCLEVKDKDGELSKVQKIVHPQIEMCGVPVAVVRSLEEAIGELIVWGVIEI